MELSDDNQSPLLLGEYIRSNPSSALSARWVFDLPEEEQGECIAKMIENAAYQETWMAYFDYAEKKGIPVNDDIVLEAIHGVGLDPYSAPLWLRAIHLCSEGKKRELFQLALRVPLYQHDLVYKVYSTFELEAAKQDGETMPNCLPISEVVRFSDILKTEPAWPDRFVDVKKCSVFRRNLICCQWNTLLRSMLDGSEESQISHDLHVRRIELAFRQLCIQFALEDVCWYAYACFVAVDMKDEAQALEILERGRECVGQKSIALCSLEALLSKSGIDSIKAPNDIVSRGIFEQRLLANSVNDSFQTRKRFRDIGKAAVAKSITDWRIYYQWASVEQCITGDLQMASKVYERGVSSVVKSLKDAILLSNEAVRYHLWRQDEREVLGYAERQIELLSSSQHEGLVRAGWNNLVNAESVLGLPSLPKTLLRRAEHCVDFTHKSMIEHYRVGNYIPCSDEDIEWLEFIDDLTKARKEEQEPLFEAATPLKHATIASNVFYPCNALLPDPSLWSALDIRPNREHSSSTQDADEVVGPRTLRGRLVYKLKVDDKTAARLKREEQRRKERDSDGMGDKVLGSAHRALQTLVEKLNSRKWNATQLRMCRCLNADWIMGTLTNSELDLVRKRS
ncbi:hypothetical protein DQ04_03381070 [Trypanosoma grayi]|uniref:hypothetical protein n=1 Tax=Trypanosoma grayi TaxID=71804 RepID=UPI0004F47DD5|nr:hypothetical protein DQ04_03381070 [Trypanosoma grayi]KEG10715.1 hypothetical protein DQ04_03381070 [Trypanosoma grayi]